MQSAIPPGDPNAIRVIGQSQGFKGLAVHFSQVFDTGIQQTLPCLETAWTPSPEELAALNAGANVIVGLCCTQHPPISLYVGSVPE